MDFSAYSQQYFNGEDVDQEQSFCHPCRMTFQSWTSLRRHMTTHTRHSEVTCILHAAKQKLPCPGCSKVFTRLGSLISHIEDQECPAVPDFKEKVKEKVEHYNTYQNIRDRVEYGNTAGDFTTPDFNRGKPAKALFEEDDELYRLKEETTNAWLGLDDNTPATGLTTAVLCPTVLTPTAPAQEFGSVAAHGRHGADSLAYTKSFIFRNSDNDATSSDPKSKLAAVQKVVAKQSWSSVVTGFPPLDSVKPPADTSVNHKNNPVLATVNSPSKSAIKPTSKSWGITSPTWETTTPTWETIKPTWETTKPTWETTTPTWEATSPAWDTASSEMKSMNLNSVAPKDPTWDINPDNPAFKCADFYIPEIRKYKCPHVGCKKSAISPYAFIQHLRSVAHCKEILHCRKCLRSFATATALAQHSESQGVRCNVRDSVQFDACVDEFTAGIVTPVGLHNDKTIKYTVNGDPWDSLYTIEDISANHRAAIEVRDEKVRTYWSRQDPDW